MLLSNFLLTAISTSYYNVFGSFYEFFYPQVSYGGRDKDMSEIRVGENETLESALKRFKRKCARAGVLAEVRKREHYEKPSVKRKKKAEAARKRKR